MPPKRSASSSSKPSTSKPSKRIRSAFYGQIGASTAADDTARLIASHHLAEHAGGGATYLATRKDKQGVESLKEFSLQMAAQELYETIRLKDKDVRIPANSVGWDPNRDTTDQNQGIIAIKQFVERLPEETANRLLSLVLYLSYQALQLPNDPGVSVLSIASIFFHRISRLSLSSLSAPTVLLNRIPQCTELVDLNLSHSAALRDGVLSKILARLPFLEKINLTACTKVGDESVKAIALASAQSLKSVNLSYTAVGSKGLASLISRCASLEVLKLQAVGNLVRCSVTVLQCINY